MRTGIIFFGLFSLLLTMAEISLAENHKGPKIWGNSNPPHKDRCGKHSQSWKNRDKTKPINHADNRLAHNQINEAIADGFIIGIEKANREAIGAPEKVDLSQLNLFDSVKTDYPKATKKRNHELKKQFNNPKSQFVSHIFEFTNKNKSAVFNQYPEPNSNFKKESYYRDGIAALYGKLQKRLADKISGGKFTHIFFMSMGWHNNQRVSICRYRILMEQTAAHYKGNFKPLVVGVTWPSSWFSSSTIGFIEGFGHIASGPNKSNDSDEIGYLHGNIILNSVIPNANNKSNKRLPVVVIGHSYGTRLTGQSIFSASILKNRVKSFEPALAIQLQPAHSIYRFVEGNGKEGYPFARLKGSKTKIVATSSRKDTANSKALFSPFLGGKRGMKKVSKYPLVFEFVSGKLSVEKALAAIKDTQKVTVLEADSFIFDHNDIMSADIGKLIAGLVRRYAK